MTSVATRVNRLLSRCKSALRRPYRSTPVAEIGPATDSGTDSPAPQSLAVISDEMLCLNRAAAERQGVESAVHSQDFIYWYNVSHWLSLGEPLEGPINYYFEDGGRSAEKLAGILAALGYEGERKIKLLEFASGYGCVSRHLKKFPQFDLVSCDIHGEAIDFLTKQIGVKAIPSAHVPEQFSPPDQYDVVFALSFFTHMPKTTFGRWLRALYNTLHLGGYLIFTTHGHKIFEIQAKYGAVLSEDGYWFAPMTEQKDLDTAEYGATITLPNFVNGEISRQTSALDITCKQADWWESQDLWIVRREK